MKEKFEAWKAMTIFRSRTILSIAVAIIGFTLGLFGLDVDLGGVIEAADGLQLGELLTALGLLAAAFFRKYLKTDLTTPGVGGAPENNG